MKAMILKEIRECSVICLLMLIGLGSTIALGFFYSQPDSLPLVSPMFHVITSFGYPAMGVWLGLTQIMVDRRRGRWDFVTHRPISRSRIFLAKVIAGLGMFFLVGIVSLLGATLFVKGPFDWRMILPRLADMFTGVVWYFAGMLVGARQARWIGSRLMPQDFAVFASIGAVAFAMDIWQALGIIAIALAIIIPAAWGAFVYGGEYEPQPTPIRFLQGLAVAPALSSLLIAVIGLLVGTLALGFGIRRGVQSASYDVDGDGRIVRVNYLASGEWDYTDVDGHPLSTADKQNLLRGNRVTQGALSLQDINSPNLPRAERVHLFGFQNADNYAMQLPSGSSSEYWFYVASRRTMEGYDNRRGRSVGSLGPEGEVGGSDSPAHPFPEPLHRVSRYDSIVASSTTVYALSLDHREIHKIFTAQNDDPILDAQPFSVGEGSRNFTLSDQDVLVRTRSMIYVLWNGQELFHVPLEHSFPPYYMIKIFAVSGRRFIFQYTDEFTSKDADQGDWFVESDEHGNILSRKQLPSLLWTMESDPEWEDMAQILAVPPAFAFSELWWRLSRGDVIGYSVIAVLSAIFAAMLVIQYSRKPAAHITWAIIAAAMGIPGVLLLLCMRQRVASTPCPSCGRLREVSEEHCPHCRAKFAPPPLLGIEIFELA
jgi:hypothetical protein